jgi:Tol biopolymer transport system component
VPSWRPDGRKVAYTRLSDDNPEVRALDIDSGEPPRLLARGAFRAKWSPDGERVFYLQVEEHAGPDRIVLRSRRADGTDERDHAPGARGGVAWYAFDKNGGALLYLRGDTKGMYRLDLKTGRAERLLGKDTKFAAAAFDPREGLLACAAVAAGKRGRQGFKIKLADIERGTERTLDVFLPSKKEDQETVPILLFSPGRRELVAFAKPEEMIAVVPLGRGRVRSVKAARGGDPYFATVSPDGRLLHLTVASGEERFSALAVDLVTGRTEVFVEDAEALVGGPSWSPDAGAVAEFTLMGLRVRTVDGRWERYFPASPDESRRLAEQKIADGDPTAGLALIRQVLEGAGPETDVQRLRLVESDAFLALGDRREAARSVLAAWLLHPVSRTDRSEVASRAAGLRGEDRLLDTITMAFRAAPGARAKALARALPFAADPVLVAGLNFRAGEAHLEAGEAQEAGKRFRLASETPEFRATDYAAGLAALAFYVAGRERYAEELLLRAVDLFPGSPLREEFRKALERIRDPENVPLRRLQDVTHPSGAAAWVTVRTARSVEWSGQSFALHIKPYTSLLLARAGERARAVFADLEFRIDMLAFSPRGDFLAFVAHGDLGSSATVLDLDGKIVLGAGPHFLLKAGPVIGDPDYRICELSWEASGKALLVAREPVAGGEREERRLEIPKKRTSRR